MKLSSLVFILLLPLFFACKKSDQKADLNTTDLQSITARDAPFNNSINNGQIKIAVLSDIHYMHPSLLQNNAENEQAFKTYLVSNPNQALQHFSVPIFAEVLAELANEHPDLLLISGDLTKDGEKVSHQAVSALLQTLQERGTRIYVVPGNNDINNFGDVARVAGALSFNGNSVSVEPAISPSEFTTYYGNYGYSNAIRDPNSLSYLAKPYPDLWVLGIDAVKYVPKASRSGIIKAATMQWIKQQLQIAKQNNALVIGLIHHNLIQHFNDQIGVMAGTVVDNWEPTVDSLISWGLKLSISGHNHSTDISEYIFGGHSFYEIETGSLITSPSAFRIMMLKNKELDISTSHVATISASLPGNMSFTGYSNYLITNLLDSYFSYGLTLSPYFLSSEMAASIAPLARNAYMAHMAGDERISPLEQFKINALEKLDPKPQKTIDALNHLWTDIGLKDLKWHIKLTNP